MSGITSAMWLVGLCRVLGEEGMEGAQRSKVIIFRFNYSDNTSVSAIATHLGFFSSVTPWEKSFGSPDRLSLDEMDVCPAPGALEQSLRPSLVQ